MDLDGISLWQALHEGLPVSRETLFIVFHETSARRRFEVHCAQDRPHGHIWNGWAGDGRMYRAENMEGLSWPAMLEAAGTSPELAERPRFYLERSVEEPYDLESVLPDEPRRGPGAQRRPARLPGKSPALDDRVSTRG